MGLKRRALDGFLRALLLTALFGQAHAASVAELEGCSAIPGDAERLACYDRVSGRPQPAPAPVALAEARADVQPGLPAVAAQPAPAEPELLSALSRHWELDDEAKQGAFLFRPHRPNYFLPLKISSAPNSTPYQNTSTQPNLGLDTLEAELQLSFKIKGMEGVFGHDNLDLWFGYTITSFWQAYNDTISSPFRETNYEPEAILTYRTDYELGGFRARFINLGLMPTNVKSSPPMRKAN